MLAINRLQLSRALILGAALALAGNSSHAQSAPAEATVPATEKAIIKVRNVTASFMGHWLDPLHNSTPVQQQISRANSAGIWTSQVDLMTRQPGNGNGPRGLKLPAGIESVLSVDPQNVLLATGTAAGLAALRDATRTYGA